MITHLPVKAEEVVDANVAEASSENEDDLYPFETGDEVKVEEATETEKPFFSFFDSSQEYLSSGVEEMARKLDYFFVEDEIFYESSGSYLRLRYSMIFDEGGKRRELNAVRFKLHLPNTEKKFKLFFESSSTDDI